MNTAQWRKMLPPKDPFSKINDEIRRMTDPLGLSGTALDAAKRASQFDPLAGLPEHVRQMVEGKGVYAGHLDAIRNVTSSLGPAPAMSESVRQFVDGSSAYAKHLNWMRQATTAYERSVVSATLQSLTGAQSPFFQQMETLRRATDAAIGPYQQALSAAFAKTNAYTGHLDAVRKATATLAGVPAMQDALHIATRGLPDWLKPTAASDMLLASWTRTAGFGAVGMATPGLIHDVLGALHRARPDTFAFDVAVTLAESFDQPGEVGAEQAADLLQRYTEALIAAYLTTKDWVVREGLFNMLILIMAAASLYCSAGSYYEGHLSRLDSDEQTVFARSAAASPEPAAALREIARHVEAMDHALRDRDAAHEADRDARVVIQSAPLRMAPDAKAPVIRMVYPDDRVRVQEVKGSWALVEVFEYKSEATVTGWINRRMLRMLGRGG